MSGGAAALVDAGGCGYELGYVGETGRGRRESLSTGATVAFEDVGPVRDFRWSRSQRHWPGWWWSSTSSRHVGYESWLERDHAMLLDFDSDVTGFASQPFWFYWPDEARRRRHAPDFFARRSDGTGEVIDVRADDRIEPADAEAFEAMARGCAQVGWRFSRVGIPDPIRGANVRWLSRYRHSRCGARIELAQRLLEVFARPRGLFEGAGSVGDRLAVLPVLFHLMWRQALVADLTAEPLHLATEVRRAEGGR